MSEKTWKVFVEADCILADIHAESEEEARQYVEKHVETGHLGPPRIKAIEEDD